MTPTQPEALRQKESRCNQKPAARRLSTAETVKEVVLRHPAALLLISAGIGVFVGCLIKRR